MIKAAEVECSCGEVYLFTYENGLSSNVERDEYVFGECSNCGCNLTIEIIYKFNEDVKFNCL
jgi:hypothetical protein